MELPEPAEILIEQVLREWAKGRQRIMLVNEIRKLLAKMWLAGYEQRESLDE